MIDENIATIAGWEGQSGYDSVEKVRGLATLQRHTLHHDLEIKIRQNRSQGWLTEYDVTAIYDYLLVLMLLYTRALKRQYGRLCCTPMLPPSISVAVKLNNPVQTYNTVKPRLLVQSKYL